jgi:hypothetical protein
MTGTVFCTNCRKQQPAAGFVKRHKHREHCGECEAKRLAAMARRKAA